MKHSNKVLYFALVVSLLIHIVFIVNGHITHAIESIEPTQLKPIELTLQEYTLDEQTPTIQTADTQTIEQQEQTQIARQQQENQVILVQSQTKKETPQNKTTVDAAQANTKKGNLNLTGAIRGPLTPKDPKNNAQQRTASDTIVSEENKSASEPQAISEPVTNTDSNQDTQEEKAPTNTEQKSILITEKDIAQNKGVIAPKGNEKITFPRSAQIKYTGPVPGEMNFQRSGSDYTITAKLKVPFKNFQFKAVGSITDGRFKPNRYTDTRGGKLYAYANFDYEKKLITYGKDGEEKTSPLDENALDIFSAAWQLALNSGTSSPLQITNGKSVRTYTPSQLGGVGREYNQGEGKLRIKVFTIPNDKKIEYGLAADFGNIPAYINFEGYILDPVGIKLDGQEYWKAVQRVK
ncbi:hypothetical protein [Neisseria sp. Ec49-e6-T10]|uniref:hypothetical protein n=1 Tax=Neisseria sp. Ec49-e6-T10 TaxID=3140744 RepID=UPI003EC0A7C1